MEKPLVGRLLAIFSILGQMCHGDLITVYQSIAPLKSPEPVLSGMILENGQENVDVTKMFGLSICVRFNFKVLMDSKSTLYEIMSDHERGEPVWEMAYLRVGDSITFIGFGKDIDQDMPSWIVQMKGSQVFKKWTTNRWHHVCMSYDALNSYITVVLDGKETIVDFVDDRIFLDGIPTSFLKNVALGRCVDGSADCSRHGGKFTDFNMWSQALKKEQMLAWTSCQDETKGDLVNWTTSRWNHTNMIQETLLVTDLCKDDIVGNVIVPGSFSQDEGIRVCKQIGGKKFVVNDRQEQDSMMRVFKQNQICSGDAGSFFWSGWWDGVREGDFTHVNNGGLLAENNFSPWGIGEPNGREKENCVAVEKNGKWKDVSCSLKTCATCYIESPPAYIMRGLCEGSVFDIYYVWSGEMELQDDKQFYNFTGYSKSWLHYDSPSGLWKLDSYLHNGIVGYLNKSRVAYPFGTHEWSFYRDTCADGKEMSTRMITFSSCNISEFTCADGTCIPLDHRCDGYTHCQDKSDETECENIMVEPSYIKHLAPPSTETGKPDLTISARITKLLDIDEVDSVIEMQFGIWLSWKDSRLSYVNLNDDESYNSLSYEDKQKIWIPSLIFTNTKDRFNARYDTERSNGKVSRFNEQGERIAGIKSSYENHLNAKIFPGSECPITIVNFFAKAFICDLDMSMYPFDIQTCRATFILKGLDANLVNLVNGSLDYLGSFDVKQYIVFSVSLLKDVPNADPMVNPLSSVSIQIILGRRLLSVILTSFVPTLILVMVSLTTNFASPKWFEGIVTVNLTTMLVIVTLFVSDTKSLPKTAYMKMIDIWAIVTMMIPFLEVVIHTMLDVLRKQKEEATEEKDELHIPTKWAEEIMDFKSQAVRMREANLNKVIEKRSFLIWRIELMSKYFLPTGFFFFSIFFFIIGSISMAYSKNENDQ